MIVRGIIYLILIIIAVRIYKSLTASMAGSKGDAGSSGEEMVKDPNCETYIPKSDAIKKKLAGESFYFCSQKCIDEYSDKNKS